MKKFFKVVVFLLLIIVLVVSGFVYTFDANQYKESLYHYATKKTIATGKPVSTTSAEKLITSKQQAAQQETLYGRDVPQTGAELTPTIPGIKPVSIDPPSINTGPSYCRRP